MTSQVQPEVVRVYDAEVDPLCEAIVVQCSDPRLQRAFREFCAAELGLAAGDFMPLVVSGGAAVLAHPERLPKEFKFMRDRLEFYRAIMPSLRRVILITHEGCRYSRALKKRVIGARSAPQEVGHEDLRVVRAALASTLERLELTPELFYARFTGADGAQVSFERVT